MRDKVIYLLSLFEASDLRQFSDYLRSPVFNRREKVTQLFDFIHKNVKFSNLEELDEEAAFKFIYSSEPFVVNKIRKLKAALLANVLEFLEFRTWNKRKTKLTAGLLTSLNDLGEENLFPGYYEKIRKNLEQNEESLAGLESLFDLENEKVKYEIRLIERSKNSHFSQMLGALELFEKTRILRYVYIAKSRERVLGGKICPDWFGKVVNDLDPKSLKNPLTKIYYQLCKTLFNPNDLSGLTELRSSVKAMAMELTPDERKDIYHGAMNNYKWQSELKGKLLMREIWDLNQEMYQNVVKTGDFPLSLSQYKNLVHQACRLEEFAWVDGFISEGKRFLSEDEAGYFGAENFNQGVYHFYQKNYSDAEKLFNQSYKSVRDVFYDLDRRVYLLIIYFETGDTVGLESQIHSFRMYLERGERVSEFHVKTYGEFIRLFRRMLSLRSGEDKKIDKLKKEIARSGLRSGQSWLLEKLAALE